ncbi:ABC transporter ATP-binding protein [Candidatus Berkelbacteria bacterium]|nr:ABC transporter ATP-binding protein [Candidatus Berkelbacteria bacterium]
MKKALQIKNLTKKYGSNIAVKKLNLEIPAGQFFGLLGPNGAGKSSTIHCITGIATISSGSIKIFGYDVEDDYRLARRQVGLAPQESNIDIFMETWRILDYMAGYYGLNSFERQQRIKELLEQFDLVKHKDKKYRELSGGLKRRVMLARAMVHNPPLLILDEPTAGVDVELRYEIWKYLKNLNDEGKTIILTSHYLEEVEQLCERVAIVNHGEVISDKAISEYTKNGNKLEDIYLKLTKGTHA